MMSRMDSQLCILFWFLALRLSLAEAEDGEHLSEEEEEEIEPAYAILFPWFVEILGVVVFFLSTRYFTLFPYTANMFLLGVFMGVGGNRLARDDQLTMSIRLWESINSEVLLLVFLPGLIFKDAYSLNVHLFEVSFGQCLIMAFPMVLAGTVLTACVAFYIFPYNWSWNLAMTFGSILSATDPVAVSALMNEVGAPPRLRMHISGESLLNDGAAIVFFTIFSGLFFTELGVEDLGEDLNVGEGFLLFFRMSLGGACIGVVFGFGLVAIMYLLNRRLNMEENVLQVASTITIAYLCYYVADAVSGTSGVIAVVFCGIIFKAFGVSLINDSELMESFWSLVEHLLNTLLFALGGVVWGSVIANVDPREFKARDWGYLFVLYVLLTVIRFVLVGSFYPIISRIGLKSNVSEALFMSYGGLRGAVGISLAIALDDDVFRNATDDEFKRFSTQLFGMVGGIAFLTLFINGSTAGPLLKKLGLTKPSEIRERLLEKYHVTIVNRLLDEFVRALSDPIFHSREIGIDFALVSHHVPFLSNLDLEKVREAAVENKEQVPKKIYRAPNFSGVIPYLLKGSEQPEVDLSWIDELKEYEEKECLPLQESLLANRVLENTDLATLQKEHGDKPETKELRLIFLEIVRQAYGRQIEKGFLDVRAGGTPGFVSLLLEEGIEFAIDAANNGQPLQDWEASFLYRRQMADRGVILFDRIRRPMSDKFGKHTQPKPEVSNQQLQIDVNRVLAFLESHRKARRYFEAEFCSGENVSGCEQLIILESMAETTLAEAELARFSDADVKHVVSHILCLVLLNQASYVVEKLAKRGLLKGTEATEKIEEIEEYITHLRLCGADFHPGELSQYEKDEIMGKKTA